MGKNHDRFERSLESLEAARKDLAVAYGGSTGAKMNDAKVGLTLAQEENEAAFRKVVEDPEG